MKKPSRQRRWQLRKEAAGLCIICGQKQVAAYYCLVHAVYQRERMRAKLGCKRRNNCKSKKLEMS
jgi:hypothetical protein